MASGSWARISDETAAGRGVDLIGLSRLAPEETWAHRGRSGRGGGGPIAAGNRAAVPPDRAADAHAAIESRATVGKTPLVT